MPKKSLKIGIDLRYPQFAFMRGIGRYTLQQLHITIANSPDHQYYLFCLKKTPAVVLEFSKYPNVTICPYFMAYYLNYVSRIDRLHRLIEYKVNFFIQKYQIDFLHIPALFHFTQPIPKYLNACPVLITVYDLIPYMYMAYFDYSPLIQAEYARGLEYIKTAHHLIAISEATKRDIVRHLGYDAQRITVVYPALDTHFQVLDATIVSERLHHLWTRLGILAPKQYILTVTDYFYTKNLDTLLLAYSRLSPQYRADYPLVVTFDISDKHLTLFSQKTQELGIDTQVIFTKRVSDAELIALYNGATFMVYPSRYEGFGYPIAEAMACGSPVITTTAASMPEVAGDAALLVDPDDPQAFVDAMITLLTDASLRQTLREKGLQQHRQFNLENMAKATLATYDVFEPHVHPKQSPRFPIHYRFILGVLDIYVKVHWQVRYLLWLAYHKIYAPFKRQVLKR